MSDSFFGFDTTLPPLNSDQLTGLEGNTGEQNDETEEEDFERKFKEFSLHPGEDVGAFDDEQNFDLSAQLVETGDDLNDETFGNVGQDFDFMESTAKMDSIQKEEEIYVTRRESNNNSENFDEQAKRRPSYAALWENDTDGMINGNGKVAKVCKEEYDNDIPDTVEGLMKLPGVGPKMAYLCMQVAWKQNQGIGVDVHVHRISNRLGWCKTEKVGPENTRQSLESWLPRSLWREINPIFVGFGQTTCLPRYPKCSSCPVSDMCPSANL
ncbi:1066_t:CDS:2 [Funneliformis mosseae]|uniref:1066_t:CDS:1 n=1 Tax=Funneliformis mosseae TaxID=27381 RepID=A0A9N8ZYR6_FUNMO|nr:1066_t:CDS:2 [Funneliformis mosseae]